MKIIFCVTISLIWQVQKPQFISHIRHSPFIHVLIKLYHHSGSIKMAPLYIVKDTGEDYYGMAAFLREACPELVTDSNVLVTKATSSSTIENGNGSHTNEEASLHRVPQSSIVGPNVERPQTTSGCISRETYGYHSSGATSLQGAFQGNAMGSNFIATYTVPSQTSREIYGYRNNRAAVLPGPYEGATIRFNIGGTQMPPSHTHRGMHEHTASQAPFPQGTPQQPTVTANFVSLPLASSHPSNPTYMSSPAMGALLHAQLPSLANLAGQTGAVTFQESTQNAISSPTASAASGPRLSSSRLPKERKRKCQNDHKEFKIKDIRVVPKGTHFVPPPKKFKRMETRRLNGVTIASEDPHDPATWVPRTPREKRWMREDEEKRKKV